MSPPGPFHSSPLSTWAASPKPRAVETLQRALGRSEFPESSPRQRLRNAGPCIAILKKLPWFPEQREGPAMACRGSTQTPRCAQPPPAGRRHAQPLPVQRPARSSQPPQPGTAHSSPTPLHQSQTVTLRPSLHSEHNGGLSWALAQ